MGLRGSCGEYGVGMAGLDKFDSLSYPMGTRDDGDHQSYVRLALRLQLCLRENTGKSFSGALRRGMHPTRCKASDYHCSTSF